jgi:hypothetical protein
VSLHLTPAMLQGAYDYLCATFPFSKWNLPDGDDVQFKVCRDPRIRGDYIWDGRKHTIRVSSGTVGHTLSLMMTMAHEMIHVHETHCKACGRGEHSAAFKKWAKVVCKEHGFDWKLF